VPVNVNFNASACNRPSRLQVFRNIHPPDGRFRVANHQVDVHWLVDPELQVPRILHVEDGILVALPRPQVRPAALELHVDLAPSGLPIVPLEFDLAIDAVIEHRDRPEDLVGLSAGRHHVADQDMLQRLRIPRVTSDRVLTFMATVR
jgi:hypothetical protein